MQEDAHEASVSFLTSFAQKHAFRAASVQLQASIHGVLLGHEDWVHSVCWVHRSAQHADGAGAGDLPAVNELTLVTASMDRTVMLWAADPASGLWMCEEAIGDAGASLCFRLHAARAAGAASLGACPEWGAGLPRCKPSCRETCEWDSECK